MCGKDQYNRRQRKNVRSYESTEVKVTQKGNSKEKQRIGFLMGYIGSTGGFNVMVP
jgi:hypothetical protein